jgi:F-type H+-transporting ATPase subunit delta
LKPHPLAKRYAKALYELAAERQSVKAVYDEVNSFGSLFEQNNQFRNFLCSPAIETQKKLNVIEQLLKKESSALFYNFMVLLIKKRRQTLYSQIVFEMGRIFDQRNNRMRAQLTTAIALSKEKLKEIQSMLSERFGSEILLETDVDSDLLGGWIVRVEGKIMDASLRSQVKALTRSMFQSKATAA